MVAVVFAMVQALAPTEAMAAIPAVAEVVAGQQVAQRILALAATVAMAMSAS